MTDSDHKPGKFTTSRRDVLRMSAPIGAAATFGIASSTVSSTASASGGHTPSQEVIRPRFFPRRKLRDQIDLQGKCVVISGASRGIGRAIGESLTG